MNVLGVVGSSRENGNTSFLVKQALHTIESKDIKTELLFLGDYNIRGCIGCEGCKDTYKCVIMDDMQKIYPLIENSDAIILGSPTYFYNITSDMKAFIERLYCYQIFSHNDRSVWSSVNEVLGGKYAVVIAICEQNNEEDMGFTAEAMKKPLEGLGYRVISTVKILNAFKKGEVLQNKNALEQVRIAAQKLEKTFMLRRETEKKLKTHIG
ncbi:flavodoxin family protein [Clostridium psychrophilum]|uniref:flavodoxin family protein n=1 Tax=Clostridium psychrophilum TaxID=132926 RepID=UPI001C0C174D|nr:flavodoxin family protein [Clostridium psychrophilum]MBU3183045.1 flavodoxin family protein [Clostridium psychrophilum]